MPTPPRKAIGVWLSLVLLSACGAGEAELFSEHRSPGGEMILQVTVAPPRMPHAGYTVAAVVVAANQAPVTVYETILENDGVPFTSHNIAARWISSNKALLCLRATDRPDRGVRIETGTEPHAVEVDQC